MVEAASFYNIHTNLSRRRRIKMFEVKSCSNPKVLLIKVLWKKIVSRGPRKQGPKLGDVQEDADVLQSSMTGE